MRISHYRPANVRAIDDQERYAQICTHKGGKSLPEGLVLPVCETPFELVQRRAEQDRIAKLRAKRFPNSVCCASWKVLSSSELLKEQIVTEINERREHVESCRVLGMKLKPEDETRIKREIALRVSELEKLEREGWCKVAVKWISLSVCSVFLYSFSDVVVAINSYNIIWNILL